MRYKIQCISKIATYAVAKLATHQRRSTQRSPASTAAFVDHGAVIKQHHRHLFVATLLLLHTGSEQHNLKNNSTAASKSIHLCCNTKRRVVVIATASIDTSTAVNQQLSHAFLIVLLQTKR